MERHPYVQCWLHGPAEVRRPVPQTVVVAVVACSRACGTLIAFPLLAGGSVALLESSGGCASSATGPIIPKHVPSPTVDGWRGKHDIRVTKKPYLFSQSFRLRSLIVKLSVQLALSCLVSINESIFLLYSECGYVREQLESSTQPSDSRPEPELCCVFRGEHLVFRTWVSVVNSLCASDCTRARSCTCAVDAASFSLSNLSTCR